MHRRLAAIVHADIAGFTRMMEGSETRTFRHLKTAQIEVWRRLIDGSGDAGRPASASTLAASLRQPWVSVTPSQSLRSAHWV